MRYAVRTVVGLGLLVLGITAISYAIYQLLQVGTCAQGGPYEIALECPAGTERVALAIPVSVFVMLAGLVIYGTWGAPPGGSSAGDAVSGLSILWVGVFLGIAFACFWGVWGPNANPGPGGKEGGLIVGFLFLPMGLLGVWPLLHSARARRRGAPPGADLGDLVAKLSRRRGEATGAGPAQGTGTGAFAGGGDRLAKLERLQRLREAGAIDDAEFERLKREVMAE
jgi:hypothetical protein